MNLQDALTQRRSYRHYLTTPVRRDHLELLIEAATKAPVSCNLQLSHFIIIDDPNLIKILSTRVSYKFSYAPACILVLNDNRFTRGRYSAIVGAGMAVENILLKAVEQGLATCAMAGFKHDARIKKILSIPDYMDILLIVAVGYPDQTVPLWPVEKVSLQKRYSYNEFKNFEPIKSDSQLSRHSVSDVITYRKRIASVYLDRFRLNTFDDSYYADAATVCKKFLKEQNLHGPLLDLMSYDGVFLKNVIALLGDKRYSYVATDYLEHNLNFLKNSLCVETHVINSENKISLPIENHYVAVTFMFQIQFTPERQKLFTEGVRALQTGGLMFIALVKDTWPKKLVKFLFQKYNSIIKMKVPNIYEQNPYYKNGPFRDVSRREMLRMIHSNSMTIVSHIKKTILGRQNFVEYYVLKK